MASASSNAQDSGDFTPTESAQADSAAPAAGAPLTPLLDQIFQQMSSAAEAPAIDAATFESFGKVAADRASESELTIAALKDLVAAATASLRLPDQAARREMQLAVSEALWENPDWRPRLQKFWTQLVEALP